MGQLYLSFDATSPEKIWPGTKWTQLTGRFLRAANDTGTGGSDSVTLTIDQLPSHNHASLNGDGFLADRTGDALKFAAGTYGRKYNTVTANAGGGKAFDNRPAYQDVYVWRRTS